MVPLLVRVARCNQQLVRPASWVNRQLKAANAVFKPFGVVLQAKQDSFSPAICDLVSAVDRHALAAHVVPGQINVLVVRSARDLDLPSYRLMGVHWRYRGPESQLIGRRWVILTARAKPPVLAHELCHFFHLPHDPAGGNLMTPGPSDPLWRQDGAKPEKFKPRLTRQQGRRLRRAVIRMHRVRQRRATHNSYQP